MIWSHYLLILKLCHLLKTRQWLTPLFRRGRILKLPPTIWHSESSLRWYRMFSRRPTSPLSCPARACMLWLLADSRADGVIVPFPSGRTWRTPRPFDAARFACPCGPRCTADAFLLLMLSCLYVTVADAFVVKSSCLYVTVVSVISPRALRVPVDHVYGRRVAFIENAEICAPEIVGKDYLAVFSLPLIVVAVDAIEELSPFQHRTEELPSLTCGYPASLRHCSGQVFGLYSYYIILL